MRANVLTDWEKLEMRDVPVPQLRKDEILVRVIYAGICGSDVTVFHHRHLTATVPRIMCHEILGEVVKINSDKDLPYGIGDRVVVHPLKNCGECDPCLDGNFHVCKNLEILGLHLEGGFAEYVAVEAKRAFRIAEDIPDKVAALTEPLAVGYHACSRALLSPEESVLVIGGGPIGIISALAAKYFQASKVVVAELNKERLEFIRSLGFDVIDTGAEDLIKVTAELTGGNGFDKVIETSGSAFGEMVLADVTKIRGKAVLVGIPSVPREFQINKLVLKEIEIIGSRVHTLKDFGSSYKVIEKLYRENAFEFERMISAEFPLERLEEGLALHESGTMTGKILIKI